MALKLRKLSYALGAEVCGVDISKPMSETEFGAIYDAFLENGILLFRGQEITPRTDLYALGCVLFEMLTGRMPFEGASPTEIIDRILHDVPPPVSRFTPASTAMLDMVVARALERIGDNAVDIGEQTAFVVTGLFREFSDASHRTR